MPWWNGGDWWGMGLAMLAGSVIWILLVVLVVWLLVRGLSRGGGLTGGGTDSAEDLLRKRYASGEIDAEEYQRRLEVLRKR